MDPQAETIIGVTIGVLFIALIVRRLRKRKSLPKATTGTTGTGTNTKRPEKRP